MGEGKKKGRVSSSNLVEKFLPVGYSDVKFEWCHHEATPPPLLHVEASYAAGDPVCVTHVDMRAAEFFFSFNSHAAAHHAGDDVAISYWEVRLREAVRTHLEPRLRAELRRRCAE